MCKFLIFIIILLEWFPVINGQPRKFRRSEPKFGYGVKGGVNVSSQYTTANNADYDIRNIIRYNGGGYVNYFFNKYFAVQPELLLSGKGVHWKDFYDDKKDILTYLDIPLMAKYQPFEFLNIQAGPQLGVMVRAMQKDKETGIKAKINEDYKVFDFSLAVGVEGNLPNRINLTFRYILGLSSATTDLLYIDPWYNSILQLSLGYRFNGR